MSLLFEVDNDVTVRLDRAIEFELSQDNKLIVGFIGNGSVGANSVANLSLSYIFLRPRVVFFRSE